MNFKDLKTKLNEYGVVEQVNYPITLVSGLPGAKVNERVVFENGDSGRVLSLNNEVIEVISFGEYPVTVGTQVARSDEFLSIKASNELLGKVINPLGEAFFESFNINSGEKVDLDADPKDITKRSRVTKQLVTGLTIVDQLVPLGKGQRELIVGDKKTGKTTALLPIIKSQALSGSVIIYAGIGKKVIEIKSLKEEFEKEKILNNICIVATTSDTSPSLIDLTPYSAMALAEYFNSKNKDVLVVFDDLSTHARFYREISLLAKMFPGRDSYPGDIFHKHAKLLERAGYFKVKNKLNSITALPLAETVEGDLTDYIVSNLISITDGHILFDTNSFNRGIRPAVNVFLSVTRVGKQTQSELARNITSELTSFLSNYERAVEFSHFGSELSGESKQTITKGDSLYKLFEQQKLQIIPLNVQMFMVGVIWSQVLTVKPGDIPYIVKSVSKKYQKKEVKKLIDNFCLAKDLNDMVLKIKESEEKVKDLCKI